MRKRTAFWGIGVLGFAFSLSGCGGSQATDMSGYNSSTSGRSFDNSSAVSSATSFGAATLGAKLLPIEGKSTFVTGLNVTSFSGQPGREFGKNPGEPTQDPSYTPKTVTSALQDISEFGCNAIRIILFNKLDGLKLDSNGIVTGVDESFVKNLSDMLGKAESAKLHVYVCLSSNWAPQTSAKNPITDVAARSAFLKNAVTPLIGKLRGRSTVLALDVIDGIESDVAGKDGNKTDKGATWDQAREYIRATVDIVKSVDSQRLVTCSSSLHGADNLKAGKFSKLNLDFYDFHVFEDQAGLPTVKELRLDRPVILGSCGQKNSKVDNELQAKTDIAFLTNAFQNGYAGALLSEYGKGAEASLSLTDNEGKHRPVVAQIQSFVSNLATFNAAK